MKFTAAIVATVGLLAAQVAAQTSAEYCQMCVDACNRNNPGGCAEEGRIRTGTGTIVAYCRWQQGTRPFVANSC
ncbi:hypothetical protein BS50DRAFT_635874 [Corynespora cassiicola Philippines]|uniref:Extracellular membrane protein CFEM domain-containing protein n=1 Tax=Corynespora cassiicola Philippines TaxID=1448308 RepID=A0A2T2NI00_CORCC|nr:hypothetical protein BS50DRAFT_635874 [Corynespora cassiicola Philippines]